MLTEIDVNYEFAAPGRVSWTTDDENLWKYLFCLSEMQELRLPCSEETLASAIGFDLSYLQDDLQVTSNRIAIESDPRLLVRTLLRDEGHQSAVSELCRLLITIYLSSIQYI